VVSVGDTTVVCDCGCKYTVNLEEYYYTQLTRSIRDKKRIATIKTIKQLTKTDLRTAKKIQEAIFDALPREEDTIPF